jgi:glyoxylase-like metal-dependent hydrolase (beta-lactamase superfamily II)
MPLSLYALTCGWLTLPEAALIEGGDPAPIRIPVPAYLIVHPKGTALFDSGLAAICSSSSPLREAYLGKLGTQVIVERDPSDGIDARLANIDVDVARVDWIINSHLHLDHAGGNVSASGARLLVQRREWEAAHDPDLIEAMTYKPVDYDHGHDRLLIEGEHDVFGDGSVVCIPTYGHTPGHQSLRVRLESGEVVLAGDACYLREMLASLRLPPGAAWNREAMTEALLRLRALEARGARIFYGHDPVFWRDLPQAPHSIT